MKTTRARGPQPSEARQAVEIADRLGKTFGGSLTRTAIYRCVCTSQQALAGAGAPPTTELVERLARTAIEQRLGRSGHAVAHAGQDELLATAS